MKTIVSFDRCIDGTTSVFVRDGAKVTRRKRKHWNHADGNVAKRHKLIPVEVNGYTFIAIGPEIPVGSTE